MRRNCGALSVPAVVAAGVAVVVDMIGHQRIQRAIQTALSSAPSHAQCRPSVSTPRNSIESDAGKSGHAARNRAGPGTTELRLTARPALRRPEVDAAPRKVSRPCSAVGSSASWRSCRQTRKQPRMHNRGVGSNATFPQACGFCGFAHTIADRHPGPQTHSQ